jgi:LmbE family N-acetylglucosaminyl deacetylase
VISPHPDDDVIACGGTIARARDEGAVLNVLYVTDGAASHVGSTCYPPHVLRSVREDEARRALELLGVPAEWLHFLREADTKLARTGPAAAALAARIAAHVTRFAPTMVFSPWIRDGHGDHVATSIAVRRALTEVGSRAELFEYTVWLEDLGAPHDGPRTDEARPVTSDVGAFRARKMEAVRTHRSQLGGLIEDAVEAFVLPESLLRRADVDAERFFRIARDGRVAA